MSLTDHSPCWPAPDADPTCCPGWESADPALKARLGKIAAQILSPLTGGRYGVCELTVRPCGKTCGGGGPLDVGVGPPFYPLLTSDGWVNCRVCSGACSCCHVCKVDLDGPAQTIVRVLVDGVQLPPEAYRIDNHRELVRVDGGCWPECADLTAPVDDVDGGAFAVTYTRGLPLDEAAMHAYSTYACELLNACRGDDCCRLPERVTTITRQGVTVGFVDPMTFLDEGRTGIPEVDQWIASVNPYGLRQRSRVLSPDRPKLRRTSWP
ncbi:hypothetical protein AB0F88_16825 [Streptosporangium sp. NPDC023963]|uniref:hypothetical protein n=1 Tax=Streptosporangium sp. NPDC023963 TaxID=3155608 RepID=UPI0034199483